MTTASATLVPPTNQAAETARADRPSFSIVLETENVVSAGLDYLRRTLATLEAQTVSPRDSVETIVTQSGDVPDDVLAELGKKYPWVRPLTVPEDIDYYQAKMTAVREARGEIVVFADSDCAYEPDWLERLLEPFQRDEVQAVAGHTGMTVSDTFEMGMSAVYFLHPQLSRRPGDTVRPGHRYFANNVAFRRTLLERRPIPEGRQFLRGQCTAHAEQLAADGVVIWQQPHARAVHPPLRRAYAFVWRFLLLGEEEVMRARLRHRGAAVILTVTKRLLRRDLEAPWRLLKVLRDQPRHLWRLPGAAAVAGSALALAHAGALLELVAPGRRLSGYLRRRRR
ncbi:MAG TPA: glycosyltransferase family 2 protein [Thermoanaerobaculia bacterium]|nr:glycosyltransferase family 2 protein [Thermoanaerobaculia bacterium]